MGFEEFELKVRQQLACLSGPVGFETAEDIVDMTVSRWPLATHTHTIR
jgi:hypothetical protein